METGILKKCAVAGALKTAFDKAQSGTLTAADLDDVLARVRAEVIFTCEQLEARNIEQGGHSTGWEPPEE